MLKLHFSFEISLASQQVLVFLAHLVILFAIIFNEINQLLSLAGLNFEF